MYVLPPTGVQMIWMRAYLLLNMGLCRLSPGVAVTYRHPFIHLSKAMSCLKQLVAGHFIVIAVTPWVSAKRATSSA